MNPEILRLITEAANHLYTTQDMTRVRDLAREIQRELRQTEPGPELKLANLVIE